MEIKGRYYFVDSKNFALLLSHITGQQFYTYDDRFIEGKKCYSFQNTEKLKIAIDEIYKLKIKLKNI